MRTEPLAMRKSVDDSRLYFDETTVMVDAMRRFSNPHALRPSEMASPEGGAFIAALSVCGPLDEAALLERAEIEAQRLNLNTDRARLLDFLQDVKAAHQADGTRDDAAVATCAARLRMVEQIRKAEEREQRARMEADADATIATRQAYIDAMLATNAAHAEAPSRQRTLRDILAANRQRRIDSQGKTAIGIETSVFPQLSNAFCGWRGLTILAAMPGIGKTTLATAAAFNAVEGNADVCMVFVSFEMPTDTLVDRTTSQMAGIGQRVLRLGDSRTAQRTEGMLLGAAQLAALHCAESRLLKLGERVTLLGKTDIGSIRATDARGCMAKVERAVVEAKERSGASRSFVVLDHFGAIPVEPTHGEQWANDTERARVLLSGLITLRDRLGEDNPIVVVAQSRKADYAKPALESIIGTADSGYAADAVVVFRPAKDETERKPSDPIDIVARIDKGRDMMLRRDIALRLDPTTSRIEEVGG